MYDCYLTYYVCDCKFINSMSVCMCVCVCERETERERERVLCVCRCCNFVFRSVCVFVYCMTGGWVFFSVGMSEFVCVYMCQCVCQTPTGTGLRQASFNHCYI